MRWLRIVLGLCPLLALSLSGCGRKAAQQSVPAPAVAKPPADVAKTYRFTGTVRSVDKDQSTVTIRHDEIPGFMSAMTMPFRVKNRELLDDVHPDDEVEGTLRVSDTASELTALDVTRPAPPKSLKLKMTGAGPVLETPPKLTEVGEVVPDFLMTTQDGKALKLSDLRGKVVVLTFIYTRCPLPDFCPLMDRKFADLEGRISAFPERAEHVRLLSVSFDPEHDTPEVLRQHAEVQGAKPPLWTFAVASHAELSKVASAIGLTYGPSKDEVIHNLVTVVIDPEGKLVDRESGKSWKTADLLKEIYRVVPRR